MIGALPGLLANLRMAFGTGTSDSGGTTTISTTDLFNWASLTWSSPGNIAGTARARGITFSFIDSGYWVGGSTSVADVDKWKWGTESWAASTALTTAVRTQEGFNGSSGKGVSIGGRTTSTNTTASEKFDKSAETWSAGTSLGTARTRGMSSGCNTFGLCMGGHTVDGTNSTVVATTTKYTYSGDSVAAGTTLTTALAQGAHGCLASPEKGFYWHGKNNVGTDQAYSEWYKFSDDTTTGSSETKGTADNYVCGASFPFITVLMGGTSSQTATNTYSVASGTVTSSTATSTGRTRAPGVSSAPPYC